MELSLSKHYISRTILLLLGLNLLLWEKAASVPECVTEEGGCWNPLVETFNSAIKRVETIRNLVEEMHQEFFHNEFSSRPFAVMLTLLNLRNAAVYRARVHCHSNITNPPDKGPEHISIKNKKYLKMLINFVGSWSSPLFHLTIELSAMQDTPEAILSKANEIEQNNKELLDDLRWILTKVYPTAKTKEKFPRWEFHQHIKSDIKEDKFLAMFNLSFCLRTDIFYTEYHLKILKCRITGRDC